MIFLAFTAIFSLMADAASENCSRKGNEVVRSMHAPGCFIEAISSSRASRGLSSGASWRRVKVFRPDRNRAEREREGEGQTPTTKQRQTEPLRLSGEQVSSHILFGLSPQEQDNITMIMMQHIHWSPDDVLTDH